MVVSNFGTLLNENRFGNVMARLREAGYFDRKDNREFHEYENFAYQTGLVGEFIKMIRHLSEKYPEMTILVRPHPVERSEEHTSELQSRGHLVCRLLLEKKK